MDTPEKPLSEKGTGNCVDAIKTVTKQCSNITHSSTNLSTKQASLKKIERYVYQILLDKSNRKKPENNLGDSVKTAVKKNKFCKSGTTNWSLKLYTNSDFIKDS